MLEAKDNQAIKVALSLLDVIPNVDRNRLPKHLPALLAAGLRSVSVAPPLVGRVKRAIASIDAGRRA